MSPTTFTPYARVILITTLLWPLGGQADPLDIPDFPLFLTSAGVPPNLILTLDDSGSMSRAFTPDLCGNPDGICNGGNYDSDLNDRFVKSADYNPIYYNPKTTYTLPVDANGNALSTSFTNAYINGFNPSYGTVNLSNNYQPSSGLYLHSSTDRYHQFMQHYGSDVACNTVSGTARCQYNSTVGSASTTWVDMHSPIGNCTTSCSRQSMPAYYYVYDGSNIGCTGAPADKLKNNSCYDIKIVSSTSGADRGGDGTISPAEADERQNFANWYSFYRTRNLMTVSAASLAMATLPEKVRVAWQALNSCRGSITNLVTGDCEGWETTATNFSNAIKPFSGTHKNNFYTWLMRLRTNTSTPLPPAMERVGNYCKSADANSPQTTCRKNYHLMMTDGIWNVNPVANYGNYDSTNHTLPDGKDYPSHLPYSDANSNSLADVAFYYWATDLGTLDNKVVPSIVDPDGVDPDAPPPKNDPYFNPKNDPATWQHLVNYTVGLGLTPFLRSTAGGSLTWGSNTYDGSYPDIVSGSKNWPTTSSSGVDGNAADLWHAAINSRGKFYNVQGPSELKAAFLEIVNTISSAATAGGGARVSTNVARITEANPAAFVAQFKPDWSGWSGSLQAFPINADGTLGTTAYWEAGSLIPPGNLESPDPSRKIFTRNGGNAQEFTITNSCTSGDLKTKLDKKADGTVDNLCSQRLAWLRGYTAITGASWNSVSKIVTFTAPNHGLKAGNSVVVTGVTPSDYEGTYTVVSADTNTFTVTLDTDPGTYVADETDAVKSNDDRVHFTDFRDRSSILGDIMNSGTVYAHKEDFGYGDDSIKVTGGGSSYKTYVTGKTSRTPVVYVGANDGMLHAFNAEVSGANMGKELFAYVPAGVYDNLSALTDLAYGKSHKYFVDGTPTLRDVYIDDGWKTYLVGGLRSGGKSIYALDVSDPNNFAAANVKWEFNDSSDPNEPGDDMGLTFGQPQIAAVSEDRWAVIFGNGYNSASEDAVLYIVDLADGLLIARIRTDSSPSNGLSTPYPFDKDGDGIVDVIYAGDLQGNLWKFEKNLLGTWVLGNDGKPLFKARISSTSPVQAITTQPKAALVEGKVMVYFGTGRYLEASDLTNDNMQSFYGIWDKSENLTVSRNNLLQQTIVSSTVAAGSFTAARTITNHTTTDPSNRGCYLDFPATTGEPSERIASSSLIKSFKIGLATRVIFTTSTPTSDPCEKSGTSWLMELSTNCGRLDKSPFDINGDQQFNASDLVTIGAEQGSVSGLKLKPDTGMVNEITWVEGDPSKGIAYKLLPGTSGEDVTHAHRVESIANSDDKVTPGGPPKRISWEQIQ